MTRATALRMGTKEKKLTRSFFGKCCFAYMTVFMAVLFFKCPSETSEWMRQGLRVCAERLVPSLFPFMVISSLLLSSGLGEWLGRTLGRPCSAIFGVGAHGAAALLLGWLCGFPIGARVAARLYAEGKLCGRELERIVCISSVPSPVFLINAVGVSMLCDIRLGVALYAACILASIAAGIAMRLCDGGAQKIDLKSIRMSEQEPLSVAFTRAVSESALGMLYVCGFVVFFSAFVGVLDSVVSSALGEYTMSDALFGFFEITSGLSRLSASSMPKGAALVLCAATAGWSGVSVHLQVISLCSECELSALRYFLASFFKAVIAALVMLLALPALI